MAAINKKREERRNAERVKRDNRQGETLAAKKTRMETLVRRFAKHRKKWEGGCKQFLLMKHCGRPAKRMARTVMLMEDILCLGHSELYGELTTPVTYHQTGKELPHRKNRNDGKEVAQSNDAVDGDWLSDPWFSWMDLPEQRYAGRS